MNWGSASEFFAMGGYGLYVWGSYGVSLLALVAEPWLTARRHRHALATVADASYDDMAAVERADGGQAAAEES